jgi:hypothetical protein
MRPGPLIRFVAVGALTGLVCTVTSLTGGATSQTYRRGGPRDWSHGRLIATRFGPDLDLNVERDWRTHAKHRQAEQMRALANRPTLDFFDLLELLKARRGPHDSGSTLDWNLRTGGFGNVVGSPAKYSFDITASNCADVIYFTVDQAGAASTPNVIAITNAYAGCSGNAAGTTPTVKWGIRMAAGTATSAVPSLDGKVLYVLESGSSVVLHAINVDNITTNPGTYDFGTQAWSNAHTLAAPTGTATSEQLFQMTFAGVTNNVSSPYLDYAGNQLFFGDSAGRIQHVVNTHLTTAARDTTNFTNACGTSQLQSPVFVNDQVIVSSYNGRLYRLNTAGASPYACVASQQAGTGTSLGGALSPPVVDVTNNQIIVTTNDANGFGIAGIGTFGLMFASGDSYTTGVQLGASGTTMPVPPSFDDAFWSTNNGNMYAVGSPTAGGNTYLVRFPYNGGLGSAAGYAQLHRSGAAAVVDASPVTEFLTASSLANKDFVFVGGGGGTYLFMNRIGAGFAGSNASPTNMDSWFAVTGGAVSGIVVDTRTANVTGATATANIYFGTKGVGASTQSTIVQLAQQF